MFARVRFGWLAAGEKEDVPAVREGKDDDTELCVADAAARRGELLGRGSHGAVHRYSTDQHSVAVKEVADESAHVEVDGFSVYQMMPADARNMFLPAQLVPSSTGRCRVAMPVAEWVLYPKAAHSTSNCVFVTVVMAVGLALDLLRSCGYAYCDLKPENIVARRVGDVFHLAFCDLGGLVPLGGTSFSTYPPPKFPRGKRVPATEGTMLWGLGAFAVSLLYGHDKGLYHKNGSSAAISEAMTRHIKEAGAASQLGRFLSYVARRHSHGGTILDALTILGGGVRPAWPSPSPAGECAPPTPAGETSPTSSTATLVEAEDESACGEAPAPPKRARRHPMACAISRALEPQYTPRWTRSQRSA